MWAFYGQMVLTTHIPWSSWPCTPWTHRAWWLARTCRCLTWRTLCPNRTRFRAYNRHAGFWNCTTLTERTWGSFLYWSFTSSTAAWSIVDSASGCGTLVDHTRWSGFNSSVIRSGTASLCSPWIHQTVFQWRTFTWWLAWTATEDWFERADKYWKFCEGGSESVGRKRDELGFAIALSWGRPHSIYFGRFWYHVWFFLLRPSSLWIIDGLLFL